jgi:metacaspase-1
MPTGQSIHIGLNHVDPNAYNGWDGALAGCVNDARDMQAIADRMGYSSTLLIDSQAVSSRVIGAIGLAAQQLTPGDILLLTYSGHGGQIPDVNGDEPDAQDETWVLWDRQLLDDELYALWSHFAAGVRICMLSDSCHSGTVLRRLGAYTDLLREVRRSKSTPSSSTLDTLKVLSKVVPVGASRGGTPSGAGANGPAYPASGSSGGGVATAVAPPAAPVDAGLPEPPPLTLIRAMPPDIRTLVNERRASENASLQWLAGPSERSQIGATVLLISGCQDDQLSLDGSANGLFTEKLKQVWNNGQYVGDYRGFWRDISARMPTSQTPNFELVGAPNPTFEQQQPFTIGAGGGGNGTDTEPGTTGPGTPTGRPTLRYGDRGEDVRYLQQRLQQQGYTVDTDGIFGDATYGRVVEFQELRGLDADGVVGPMTWQALESASPTPATPTQPTTPTSPARPTLRRGSRGQDVMDLQQKLRAQGYFLVVDGDFGYRTESAVRSFQNANGLNPDGIVGPQTWAALG